MTNPIDSLPATPETVGMQQPGDMVWCHKCLCRSSADGYEFRFNGASVCWACGSYDVEKVKP